MKKRLRCLIIVSFLIIAGIIFIRLGSGDEDNWRCEKNKWVMHGHPSQPKPDDPCGVKTPLPRTKEACLGQGGVWKKQGPEPFETCNRKAKDRGTICRDSSECEGMCQATLSREEMYEGMRGKLNLRNRTGQCSVWVVELGCIGIVKEGNVQVLCID